MATLTVSNVFAPSTLIESAEANQNFQDVVTFVNGSVMHRDASGAFTAVPSGPGSDPVSDNQLPRKRYVDVPYGFTTSAAFNTVSGAGETQVTGFVSVSSRRMTMSGTGMTLLEGGLYQVMARGEWPTNAGGTRRAINVKVNGASIGGNVFPKGSVDTSGFGASAQLVVWVPLIAGDVVTMFYSQDAGVNLSTTFKLIFSKVVGT